MWQNCKAGHFTIRMQNERSTSAICGHAVARCCKSILHMVDEVGESNRRYRNPAQ